jgi:cytochrome c-type biogenesis protein CcmH/NrfG
MRIIPLIAVLVTATVLAPAYAQEDNAQDKAKAWCTDAHMQQMDESIAKMTDAAKQKEANSHLVMSKEAMQNNDMEGCVQHMEETHKSMGL